MGWTGVRLGGRVSSLFATLVLALALTVAVACNSGGSSGSNTPGVASGTATPAGTATPNPQPTVDGSGFIFPARGYAVTIPDGWHANPNSLIAPPQKVDAFFSNDTTDGVQSNISVTCADSPPAVTTADFVAARTTTLQKLGATDLQTLTPPTVGGIPAVEISYTLTRDKIIIKKLDVMFVNKTCAWTLASASAPSLADQNATIFSKFLASFRVLSDATPASGA